MPPARRAPVDARRPSRGSLVQRRTRPGAPSRALALLALLSLFSAPGWAAICAAEQEPNDSVADATDLADARCLEGTSEDGKVDYFRWILGAEEAAEDWQLRVLGPRGALTRVRVLASTPAGEEGRELAKVEATRVLATRSSALRLPAGKHLLWVASSAPGNYRVQLESRAQRRTGTGDLEPNDDVAHAAPVTSAFGVAGDLAGSDDYYAWKLSPADAQQRWRLSVKGAAGAGTTLTLLGSKGETLVDATAAENGVATLHDLGLSAGTHRLVLGPASEGPAAYEVRAEPIGPRAIDLEDEPNYSAGQAKLIDGNRLSMRGRFAPGDVGDSVRVHVEGRPQLWRAEALGRATRELSLRDAAGNVDAMGSTNSGAAPRLDDLFLAPGDHWLWLAGDEGEYTLRLTPLGVPDPRREREPNDDDLHAEALQFGALRLGRLPTFEDQDVYRFTVGGQLRALLDLQLPEGVGRIHVGIWRDGSERLTYQTEPGARRLSRFLLLGRGDYQLAIRLETGACEELYQLRLTLADPFAVPRPTLPVALRIELSRDVVAAHWPTSQRLRGELVLQSESDKPQRVALTARTSADDWVVKLTQSEVELPPRSALRVPFRIGVAPDVSPRNPVQLAVRAKSADGSARSALRALRAATDAEPSAQLRTSGVPAALRGGLDVAWIALGALPLVPANPDIAGSERELFDGLAQTDGGFVSTQAALPFVFSVDLAGDAPVPVAGFAFTLTGPQPWAQDVEVELSLDGSQWVRALKGALRLITREQYFVLPRSVSARFARLRIVANRAKRPEGAALAEWKVIAAPGAASAAEGFDLADPRVGGHLVWARPAFTVQPAERNAILYPNTPATVQLPEALAPSLVLGFHNNRAAQISELSWSESERTYFEPIRMLEVEVGISTASPLGPWRSLGVWKLRGEPGAAAPFRLEKPVWARYLRLSATGVARRGSILALPEKVAVRERAASAEYQSILGEWGQDERDGSYEALVKRNLPAAEAESAHNDSAPEAQPLARGEAVRGVVFRGRDEDWYRVAASADANTLIITSLGEPTVKADVEVRDATGALVPLRRSLTSPSEIVWKARVLGGASYLVRVFDPPRSVVVAFDASGSMSPFLGSLRRGLNAFAAGVVPGREAVNLLPFEKDFVLRDWSDQGWQVQSGLRSISSWDTSSSAEATLLQATEALAERPGAKAIVLLTDADTTSYEMTEAMWGAFERVRPRIFAVHVGGAGDPAGEQDLMQDWADQNAGHYGWVRAQTDIDAAFDRAAAWLRRPAEYLLRVDSRREPPPGPGSIRVVSAPSRGSPADAAEPPPARGAVELILDASGSMLQPFEGQRRIDVAREALTRVVAEAVPPGAAVALRAFGHTAPGSCQTLIESELAPLDAPALAARIAAIEPVNLAKTPIADSLRQVAVDLADVLGTKTVVLVTDGEETCGGDPAREITALREAGFDVRVNVVGFAVEDAAIKAQFRAWAKAGQGEYFDARDAKELGEAVARAVRVPFRVLAEDGTVVARGQVGGDAPSVKAGVYRVEVEGDPPAAYESVEVVDEETTELRWEAPRLAP